MKLNSRDIYPDNNTMWFAVNNATNSSFFGSSHSSGFVGIVLFLDGKWYSMPLKEEIDQNNKFFWIDLNSVDCSKDDAIV